MTGQRFELHDLTESIHGLREDARRTAEVQQRYVVELKEAIIGLEGALRSSAGSSAASIKISGAENKGFWFAIVSCIVVSALFYQSNQWYSSQIILFQLEHERQKDRTEDYFSMHMNAINQVRAKLDLKLIEPLPKKDEKEAKK